jgi:hypothetical protein
MQKISCCFIALLLFIVSCTPLHVDQIPAYYVNPLNGEMPVYKPNLVREDSVKSAAFVTGGISFGGANDDFNDQFTVVNAGISRSHLFNRIGLRYGANLLLGSYKVNKVDPDNHHSTVDPDYINKYARPYSFGSYGADGGIHYSAYSRVAEFHVLGAEFSMNKEFGHYLKFRKDLPVNVATHVDDDPVFGTVGIYSEVINRTQKVKPGIKVGFGRAFNSGFNGFDYDGNPKKIHYNYFSVTPFLSKNHWSGSIQLEFGQIGSSLQLATHYRL